MRVNETSYRAAEARMWERESVTPNDTDTMRNELATAPPIVHPLHGVNDSIFLPDDLLQRVTAPVSFIWGTEDAFGGQQIATRFADRLPNATLELLPGGHVVWIDDPNHVAALARTGLSPSGGRATEDPPFTPTHEA